jgi:hypothetical protein
MSATRNLQEIKLKISIWLVQRDLEIQVSILRQVRGQPRHLSRNQKGKREGGREREIVNWFDMEYQRQTIYSVSAFIRPM